MLWCCSKRHVWRTTWYAIKQGSWCPKCAKRSVEEAQSLAVSKGGLCLSAGYTHTNAHLIWQCRYKHTWNASWHTVQQGSWCPECAGVRKRTIEEARALAATRGGRCLTGVFTSVRTSLEWECQAKHTWMAKWNDVRRGTWCPYCRRPLKGEETCRAWLETYFGVGFPKANPAWLKNPSRPGRGLELDGYNEDLKLAFEYQGVQHYKPVKWFHLNPEAFQRQVQRDNEKKAQCAIRNIKLLIIPHTKIRTLDAFLPELINVEAVL